MKATTLLHRDHQEVARIFGELEKSRRGERRRELLARLERALETHTRIEEEIFYPALDTRRDVANTVREAYAEHAVVKELLREVLAMDPADERTEAKLAVLRENVEHHVDEEESSLFPAAEQMDEDRLLELGEELAERKQALTDGRVGGMVRSVRRLVFGAERPRARRKASARRRRRAVRTRAKPRARRGKRAATRRRSAAKPSARSRVRTKQRRSARR